LKEERKEVVETAFPHETCKEKNQLDLKSGPY